VRIIKEKIAVNYYFKMYQRIILFLLMLLFIYLSIEAFLPIDAYADYEFTQESMIYAGLALIAFLVSMLKEGLFVSNIELYKAFFIFYIPVFRTKVDLSNKTSVVLLNAEGKHIKENDIENKNIEDKKGVRIYLSDKNCKNKRFLIDINDVKIKDFVIEILSQMLALERI